jgi:hypothetical protein
VGGRKRDNEVGNREGEGERGLENRKKEGNREGGKRKRVMKK